MERVKHQRMMFDVHRELRRLFHPLRGFFVLVIGIQVKFRDGTFNTQLYEERHEIPDDIRTIQDFMERKSWFEPGEWEDVSNVRVYLCHDV